MTARKAFTPVELRELAAEPYDFHHPHLLDALRSALLFCADVIDAANEALREPTPELSTASAGEAPLAWLEEHHDGRMRLFFEGDAAYDQDAGWGHKRTAVLGPVALARYATLIERSRALSASPSPGRSETMPPPLSAEQIAEATALTGIDWASVPDSYRDACLRAVLRHQHVGIAPAGGIGGE